MYIVCLYHTLESIIENTFCTYTIITVWNRFCSLDIRMVTSDNHDLQLELSTNVVKSIFRASNLAWLIFYKDDFTFTILVKPIIKYLYDTYPANLVAALVILVSVEAVIQTSYSRQRRTLLTEINATISI